MLMNLPENVSMGDLDSVPNFPYVGMGWGRDVLLPINPTPAVSCLQQVRELALES